MKKKYIVYLDHAAAAPLDPAVQAAMQPFFNVEFANPSGLYSAAVRTRAAVDTARKTTADILFTQPDTVIFTSGGTESINMAIQGIGNEKWRPHVITTEIEHHAVLDTVKKLESEGVAVTYLPVNREGRISVSDFKKALRPETVLVSIMYANNEIGTVQPIAEIGREIMKWKKEKGNEKGEIGNGKLKTDCWPMFHTDACQAAGYLNLNVEKLHVDLMSLNGSKIYGPKGSGILYKRRGVELEPLMYGGGQEFGMRSGTENVPGIIGFAKALELAQKGREKEHARVEKLRDYFWNGLQTRVRDVQLNGPRIETRNNKSQISNRKSQIDRLPNNLNVTFDGADSEALIIYLDEAGIQCSSGSACTEATDEVSHVLLACGLSEEQARSSIRFTLGKSTMKKDVDCVLKVLPGVVERCRKMKIVEE